MQLSETGVLTVEAAQNEFSSELIFLNTATMGLPPRRTLEAIRAALDVWASGGASAVAYDDEVARARANYAQLVGVDATLVAQGSQVSVFAGLIAASLPDHAEVLTSSGDFTSVVFPFHVQARRGVRVLEVPLEELAGAVTAETTLVAVSAVQSADGRVADLEALTQACAATGTRIMLDTTQAAGWLPVDAARFAYTVCHGYKWLLAPRGTAFLTVQRDLMDGIAPHTAGWYAGADRWNSIYGAPLRLSSDARRFDVSPAWLSWVGTDASLALLCEVGRDALHEHSVGLANRFRAGVGLAPSNSAIVSMLADDQVPELMRAARIVGVTRAGRLRLSFHVSTSAGDVDTAIEALSGHVRL
ncbi:MAG TPA: aminotransferase class V-fold PLP-dependent enzyme [Candidatus Acidoferrales bacterium]|nr:aminotransferase class V-fold PLP-dependent enzyme [Candidatus Acidoferrales bacterium]